MAKLLYKLGRWSYLHKWRVIVAWLLLLGAAAAAALSLMRPFTSEFAIEGTPAIDALTAVEENFPDAGNVATAPSVNVVFAAPEGQRLDTPEYMAAMDATVNYIRDHLGVDGQRFGNPVTVNRDLQASVIEQMTDMGMPAESAKADAHNVRTLSDDGRIGYTTFDFNAESSMSVEQADRDVVTQAMQLGRDAGLEVEAGGAGFGDPIAVKTTSEMVGLGVAFVVLVVTFGSLAASIIPLLSAVVGVGIGALLVLLTTHWVDLNNVTPVLAVMIGLAVGIDYALFILSRFRQESRTLPPDQATGMAVGTAGSSVVFAGTTVFTALVALALARIEFLTWMGFAAAATVLIAVLVALTLVPALLGAWGSKAFAGKVRGVAGNPGRGSARARTSTRTRWGGAGCVS